MAPRIWGALCFSVAFHRIGGLRPRPESLKGAVAVVPFESRQEGAAARSGNVIALNDSLLVLDVSLDEVVGQGWGSRVLALGAMHGQFTNRREDRLVAMSYKALLTYTEFDLHPSVATLPAEAFGGMLSDTSQGSVAGMQLLGVRTASAHQMINTWVEHGFGSALVHEDLMGCWPKFDDFMSQMFERVLANHEGPFVEYIGLHVRHGDKVVEGGIIDFSKHMRVVQTTPRWKEITNFFIATDDLNVIEKEARQFHPPLDTLAGATQREYAWNWTQSRHRHPGGEPSNCMGEHCHHENTVGSIQAVLDDTLSLALAPVLVGTFNSNFFRLAWLLNYLRRTPEQRQEEWCWDMYSNQPCHNRSEFVYSFVRSVHITPHVGLGLRSDGLDLLRHCMDPTLEENQ